MVNDCRDMLEEPSMRTVANVEDVGICRAGQLTPAFGHNRTYAS